MARRWRFNVNQYRLPKNNKGKPPQEAQRQTGGVGEKSEPTRQETASNPLLSQN